MNSFMNSNGFFVWYTFSKKTAIFKEAYPYSQSYGRCIAFQIPKESITLNLPNCTFQNNILNSSPAYASGCSIYCQKATIFFVGVTFINNTAYSQLYPNVGATSFNL